MNFSIVVPGGCNAMCKFCFWEEQQTSKNYISELFTTLSNMPVGCALSITGGEPTISKYIELILQAIKFHKDKFEKVILTTNGTKLIECLDMMDGIVDHINISRHHYDSEIRKNIFGVDIISDSDLIHAIEICNQLGIDITFNAVLCDEIKTKNDIWSFIKYAKDMNASAITFRQDYNRNLGNSESEIEQLFSEYKSIYSYDCPVCRTRSQIINGMKVTWKSSTFEPSNDLKDIYEFILQPNGKLTIDWAGESEISLNKGEIINLNKSAESLLEHIDYRTLFSSSNDNMKSSNLFNTSSYGGCGGVSRYSGCGGTSRYSGCGGTSRYSGCGG